MSCKAAGKQARVARPRGLAAALHGLREERETAGCRDGGSKDPGNQGVSVGQVEGAFSPCRLYSQKSDAQGA